MALLRRLLRRDRGGTKPVAIRRLLPAAQIVERFGADGGDAAAAQKWTRHQLAGLRYEVDDDARWPRLCEVVRCAADPWNADDWPLGFDALLCCVPLCTLVDFECSRCQIGREQDGMSCAHPTSAFGQLWHLIAARDREGLRAHIDDLERRLRTP